MKSRAVRGVVLAYWIGPGLPAIATRLRCPAANVTGTGRAQAEQRPSLSESVRPQASQ